VILQFQCERKFMKNKPLEKAKEWIEANEII
jgi:hypothetical protein